LLVPVSTAMNGNLVITLTVDNTKLITNVDTSISGLSTLEAGKNYQGTLMIQDSPSSASEISTKGWSVNKNPSEFYMHPVK